MQVLYYARNVVATTAGSNTLTATFDGPASWAEVRYIEYSGVSTTNALDVTASASGTSANASSGAVTTSNANDVIVGANYVQNDTPGAGSGFTEEQYSGYASILEDQYVSTTGSYSATAPESPSGWWIMQMAAFRAAGSPAGGEGSR